MGQVKVSCSQLGPAKLEIYCPETESMPGHWRSVNQSQDVATEESEVGEGLQVAQGTDPYQGNLISGYASCSGF